VTIEPRLPQAAKAPDPGWIHEIKHDGFRIIARRDRTSSRLPELSAMRTAGVAWLTAANIE
jgi:hypothetical protein